MRVPKLYHIVFSPVSRRAGVLSEMKGTGDGDEGTWH